MRGLSRKDFISNSSPLPTYTPPCGIIELCNQYDLIEPLALGLRSDNQYDLIEPLSLGLFIANTIQNGDINDSICVRMTDSIGDIAI